MLDSENIECAKVLESTGSVFAKFERLFNSFISEFSESSNMKSWYNVYLYAYQDVSRTFSNSWEWFYAISRHATAHQLYNVLLTQGSSYIGLPKWITLKTVVINPKKNNEQCFKCVVISARLVKIPNASQSYRAAKINTTGKRLSFHQKTQIGNFEKNNSEIELKMLFNSKKGIYKAQRSELNGKCSKQANLLMIVNGENRHHTTIKNLSRFGRSLSVIHKGHELFEWFPHSISHGQAL